MCNKNNCMHVWVKAYDAYAKIHAVIWEFSHAHGSQLDMSLACNRNENRQ